MSPPLAVVAAVALGCAVGAAALLWPVPSGPVSGVGLAGVVGEAGGVGPDGPGGSDGPRGSGGPGGPGGSGGPGGGSRTRRRRRRLEVVVAVAAVATLARVSPRHAVLGLIVVLAAAAGASLLRRRRLAREAERTSVRLLEACEQLTAELVSGQPPGAALEHGAREWPVLSPVAQAFRVGADVPQAWRLVAARPGADDLRLVAAAWQVSSRTGAGLASALEHVTADLRARRATRRVIAGELASARATARLIAILPVLALTFGAGSGGDPWGFLLGHPVGLACLALGLAFAVAGLAWIEALARKVEQP